MSLKLPKPKPLEGVGSRAPASTNARMAELVVGLALLRVAKDLVRLVDLLEALLGALLFIHIRVILARQPAKRLFDLIFAGVRATPRSS